MIINIPKLDHFWKYAEKLNGVTRLYNKIFTKLNSFFGTKQ